MCVLMEERSAVTIGNALTYRYIFFKKGMAHLSEHLYNALTVPVAAKIITSTFAKTTERVSPRQGFDDQNHPSGSRQLNMSISIESET